MNMNELDIKAIRKELLKTQKEFAEILGIKERAVKKWKAALKGRTQNHGAAAVQPRTQPQATVICCYVCAYHPRNQNR